MTPMDRARPFADRVLGSRPVTGIARYANAHHLRVLAYHGVFDINAFRRQMTILERDYASVSAPAVVAALRGEAGLPNHAVWVTFDDGDPSVVENALPILEEFDLSGTLFVCPGLVDTTTPFWWEVVDKALTLGESLELEGRRFGAGDVRRLTARLKTVSDGDRRGIVATLADAIIVRTGSPAERKQVTTTQLKGFIAAGGSVGNHTWDHPCLDRVDEDAQYDQINLAHEWLNKQLPQHVPVFAYPNGNHSPFAERVLADLDYEVGALFDHRLSRVEGNPLRLSRLRVDDDATPGRFAAILAGAHPAVQDVRRRMRRGRAQGT